MSRIFAAPSNASQIAWMSTSASECPNNLTLTVLSVRLEDNPYKTQLKGTTPYFYVRQVLKLKDSIGNFVSIRLNARTASRKSCQLPAVEHAYQVGELMEIASARIARTYIIGSTKYTRLTHVKLHIPTG